MALLARHDLTLPSDVLYTSYLQRKKEDTYATGFFSRIWWKLLMWRRKRLEIGFRGYTGKTGTAVRPCDGLGKITILWFMATVICGIAGALSWRYYEDAGSGWMMFGTRVLIVPLFFLCIGVIGTVTGVPVRDIDEKHGLSGEKGLPPGAFKRFCSHLLIAPIMPFVYSFDMIFTRRAWDDRRMFPGKPKEEDIEPLPLVVTKAYLDGINALDQELRQQEGAPIKQLGEELAGIIRRQSDHAVIYEHAAVERSPTLLSLKRVGLDRICARREKCNTAIRNIKEMKTRAEKLLRELCKSMEVFTEALRFAEEQKAMDEDEKDDVQSSAYANDVKRLYEDAIRRHAQQLFWELYRIPRVSWGKGDATLDSVVQATDEIRQCLNELDFTIQDIVTTPRQDTSPSAKPN